MTIRSCILQIQKEGVRNERKEKEQHHWQGGHIRRYKPDHVVRGDSPTVGGAGTSFRRPGSRMGADRWGWAKGGCECKLQLEGPEHRDLEQPFVCCVVASKGRLRATGNKSYAVGRQRLVAG